MVFANIKELATFKIDVVKKALNLSVNVFSTKVLIGDTILLRLLLETGPPFYMVIRATRRSSHL